MPKLENERHEQYAQERANGLRPVQIARKLGWTGYSYSVLERRPDIKERVEELKQMPVDRQEIIRMWREVHKQAMDKKDLTTATHALRQIGVLAEFPIHDRRKRKPGDKRGKKTPAPPVDVPDEEFHERKAPSDAGGSRDISEINRALDGLDGDVGDGA